MTNPIDPRPLYARSLTWVRDLIAGVRADQLTTPTPCPEFDVRALLGHLVATVERARVIGEGRPPFSVPSVVTGVPDDGWVAAHAAATEAMTAIWTDDALLDSPAVAPWGTVPGRAVVWGYVNEALVHGWDLAVATGQDPEAPADLSLAALAGAEEKIPADRRGDGVPFDAVVEPSPNAGPTERLANWSGRSASVRAGGA